MVALAKTQPAWPASTSESSAVVAWLVEAAEAVGDGAVERSGDPLTFTWRWPDGSYVSLTIEHTDATTAREKQAYQRQVEERSTERRQKLDRMDPLLQTMVGDLARGATHADIALWYGLKDTTVAYYVRLLRMRLDLEGVPPVQFRLELRRYAALIPALCDRP